MPGLPSPPPPLSHVETVNYCFDISLIKLNVNRPLNQFLTTETKFIVYSRIQFCTINIFSYGPLLVKTFFRSNKTSKLKILNLSLLFCWDLLYSINVRLNQSNIFLKDPKENNWAVDSVNIFLKKGSKTSNNKKGTNVNWT